MKVRYFLPGLIVICSLLSYTACVSFSKGNDRGKFIPLTNQSQTIDFEEYRELIIIEATVNGHPGKFLLDNGFTLSALHTDFAERAGVPFNRKTRATDGNNRKVSLQETTVKTVEIAGHEFKGTGFYLIDTRKFFPCKDIDGVIGASIINKANWKIEFEDKKIEVGILPFEEEEGIRMPIRFSKNNNTSIDLRIEDLEFTAKVDLGKVDHLEFRYDDFYPFFKGDSISRTVGIHSISVLGLGEIDTNYHPTQSYRLYQDKQLIEETRPITLTPNLKYKAYLGIDWFKDYTLIINSTEREYILIPLQKEAYKADSSFGIAIYPIKGSYYIIKMRLDDPELSSQVSIMDELTHINGRKLNEFEGECKFFEYYRDTVLKGDQMSILLKGNADPIFLRKRKPVIISLQ